MEHERFDWLVRAMTANGGVSRRLVLRRAASSAIASPLGFLGIQAAAADGDDEKTNTNNKDNKKDKSKNKDDNPLSVTATGGTANAQTSQTVVQTNNQVCAGDCDQTSQQSVGGPNTQAVIAENAAFFGRPPSYWVDVACTYDAPLYRTVCNCTGYGESGAPRVRKITLPSADICAYVIAEESREEARVKRPTTNDNEVTSEANAGTGGVANADASGGSVSIGDVKGNNDIAIDASGGTANADASGGDNNVAIAGSQIGNEAEQTVELSTLTLTLEGNVVPGKATTYWVDTDSGRRPAPGPALVQVADEPADAGAIIAEARTCGIGEPQQGYDWFGQCSAPAEMTFSLYSADGATPLETLTTNAQGRARFGGLQPGTYQLKPEGTIWCYAESDRVDANGNVLVETDLESHVWSFVCGGGGS